MRRNIANALSAALLGAAFFAAATPVSQAQTALRRQSQTATQSASTVAKSAAATPPASNAGAYARVKNFVDADAVLVARLDLAQLDLDAIDKSFSKFFVDSFAAQGFDATSLKEIRRELNKSLKAFKETATPLLDGFRQERGLREVYLIVPRADEPEYFVYAPLAKSKRAAVVEFAATFAPNPPFEVGSGVVFGTKKFDADYFKRFKATPNPKLEAFLAESNATLQIYVGDVNVAPAAALVGAFAQNDLAQKFDAALAQAPQETRAAVKAFDDYFIDARLELDVNALALNARFDFASADAASKTRAALAQFADAGVAELEKALIAKAAEKNAAQFEKYNVVPVVRELVRGFLTSSLPKRDGAALTLELQAGPTLPLANPLTGALFLAALPRAVEGFENAGDALQNAAKDAISTNASQTDEADDAPRSNQTDAAADDSNRLLNLKQLALATHNFLDSNVSSGEFTAPFLPARYSVDADGKPLHSWRVFLLPYLGQKELYDKIRLDEPWDSEHNRQFHDQTPAIYCRPDAPESGCVYSCVADESALLQPASEAGSLTGIKLTEVIDGTSHTILFVERSEPVCWMDPTADLTSEELLAETRAAKGALPLVLLDGRAQPFHVLLDGPQPFRVVPDPSGIDANVFKAYVTRAGGETFPQ